MILLFDPSSHCEAEFTKHRIVLLINIHLFYLKLKEKIGTTSIPLWGLNVLVQVENWKPDETIILALK